MKDDLHLLEYLQYAEKFPIDYEAAAMGEFNWFHIIANMWYSQLSSEINFEQLLCHLYLFCHRPQKLINMKIPIENLITNIVMLFSDYNENFVQEIVRPRTTEEIKQRILRYVNIYDCQHAHHRLTYDERVRYRVTNDLEYPYWPW